MWSGVTKLSAHLGAAALGKTHALVGGVDTHLGPCRADAGGRAFLLVSHSGLISRRRRRRCEPRSASLSLSGLSARPGTTEMTPEARVGVSLSLSLSLSLSVVSRRTQDKSARQCWRPCWSRGAASAVGGRGPLLPRRRPCDESRHRLGLPWTRPPPLKQRSALIRTLTRRSPPTTNTAKKRSRRRGRPGAAVARATRPPPTT